MRGTTGGVGRGEDAAARPTARQTARLAARPRKDSERRELGGGRVGTWGRGESLGGPL